jgi:hypothetical protein
MTDRKTRIDISDSFNQVFSQPPQRTLRARQGRSDGKDLDHGRPQQQAGAAFVGTRIVTIHADMRGAAAVGRLADLAPLEAATVIYLRLWCDGPDGRRQVRDELCGMLGPRAGGDALSAFDTLCGLCARHGRRAFLRHDPGCQCLGADEACLANLVALSAEGDREDALLIATLLVRADLSLHLFAAAQAFGLALCRMSLAAVPRGAPARPPRFH